MTDSNPYLYLTTIGHISGNPHEIEIWYVAHEGCYYLVSGGGYKAHWVQNIGKNAAITFHVSGEHFTGAGRIVDADAEPDLAAQIRQRMDEKYQWSDGVIVELRPE